MMCSTLGSIPLLDTLVGRLSLSAGWRLPPVGTLKVSILSSHTLSFFALGGVFFSANQFGLFKIRLDVARVPAHRKGCPGVVGTSSLFQSPMIFL